MFSEQLMKEVVRWDIPNGHAKCVLLVLASYSDIDGLCFPSLPTICKDSGFSRSTVIRALNWCEDNRIISRHHTSKYTTYSFNCIQEDIMEDETSVSQTPEEESNITRIDSYKKDITTSGVSQTPSFDMFWSAYPRKRDKGHARLAFKKHSKTTDPAIIIAGAQKYAEYVFEAGIDPQYIPYATTWLNGERWEDDLEFEVTTPRKQEKWIDEL